MTENITSLKAELWRAQQELDRCREEAGARSRPSPPDGTAPSEVGYRRPAGLFRDPCAQLASKVQDLENRLATAAKERDAAVASAKEALQRETEALDSAVAALERAEDAYRAATGDDRDDAKAAKDRAQQDVDRATERRNNAEDDVSKADQITGHLDLRDGRLVLDDQTLRDAFQAQKNKGKSYDKATEGITDSHILSIAEEVYGQP